MVRRILFSLLGLAPVVIVLHYVADLGSTTEFVLAAIALIPLAWFIGESTEHAAEHTGPGIGGFLNATFGNAPELIIALLAVHEGLNDVVRGSLVGSIIGNLLLVLGFSLVAGGRGKADRHSSFMSLAITGGAALLLFVPAGMGWSGDRERHAIAIASIPVSIVLLVVYLAVTIVALRRHSAMHIASDEAITGWSLRAALVALGVATVATALVAEVLVGSLEEFAEKAGLSDFFVAAVIVAIVGNAAEHGGAVIVAARGKIALAVEIALASAAQVAVFLVPAVALLAWLLDPVALSFRVVEMACLLAAIAAVGIVMAQGTTSRLRGWILVATYVAIAAAFWIAGDLPEIGHGSSGD